VPCLKEYAAQVQTANASGLAGLPLAYIGNVSRTTAAGSLTRRCETFSIRR
jgi:hypothetical protein